jgi:hypothetical protein
MGVVDILGKPSMSKGALRWFFNVYTFRLMVEELLNIEVFFIDN